MPQKDSGPSPSESLLTELEAAINDEENLGPKITQKLADMTLKCWGKKLSQEKLKTLLSNHEVPENFLKMVVLRVNREIWSQLNTHRRTSDLRLNNMQKTLLRATCTVLSMCNKALVFNIPKDEQKQIMADGVDTIGLLSHVFSDLTGLRKEQMKPALRPEFHLMCTKEMEEPHSLLFGDDLAKQIRDAKEATRIGITVGTSKHDRHRGYKRQHSDYYQSSNSYKHPFLLKGHKKPGYKKKTATPTQDRRLEIRQSLHLLKQQVRISTTLDYNCDFNIDFTSIRNRFHSNCQTFKAGNLAHYLSCWKDFTSDKDILSCVAGLRIDFTAKPRQPKLYVPSFSEQLAIDNELTKLAEKQVIEPTRYDPEEIISPIFVRPKKDGSHRLILNLKRLNMFSPKVHFKMDTFHTILKLVQRHCYMAIYMAVIYN